MTVEFDATRMAKMTALAVFPLSLIPEANASIGGASFATATFFPFPMDALAVAGVVSRGAVAYGLDENPGQADIFEIVLADADWNFLARAIDESPAVNIAAQRLLTDPSVLDK